MAAEQFVMGTIRRKSTSAGLDVVIDGDENKDGKYYKCDANASFAVGDRVLLLNFSGTYIVICKVGNPK